MNFSEKILRSILNPGTVLKHVWRKFPVGSFELRMKFDAFHKPSYAYGVYRASMLAKKLGLKRISVIEFGVSRGYGLLALEEIAAEVENIFDITIDVIGFDTGAGLVPVVDYRDMPYEWETGEFRMDVDALKEKLKKARLVLGDVAHTIAQEMPSFEHSPIGFISFDLDLYTSTMSAFKILDGNEKNDASADLFIF
jgi:hypothetical protein